MTPLRQKETMQAELIGLQNLARMTPEDSFDAPLVKSRIVELEKSLKELGDNPPLAPEAELFFTDGPAFGSQGLEATFTSDILNSYQNMVTNH